jgi:hypothetical protein
VPVVVSVLPDDEPIEELLPDVLGVEDEELVSLLVEPLVDGVVEGVVALEPLEEPVPEAPMLDELELGVLLDVPDDEGEAPIVDEDDEGEAPVLGLEGVVVLEAAEPAVSPPVFGAVDVLLLAPPLLPAAPPEPPAEPPLVWATAIPPIARAAAAARVVRVVLVALIWISLDGTTR